MLALTPLQALENKYEAEKQRCLAELEAIKRRWGGWGLGRVPAAAPVSAPCCACCELSCHGLVCCARLPHCCVHRAADKEAALNRATARQVDALNMQVGREGHVLIAWGAGAT
jgi:hypothetical protein